MASKSSTLTANAPLRVRKQMGMSDKGRSDAFEANTSTSIKFYLFYTLVLGNCYFTLVVKYFISIHRILLKDRLTIVGTVINIVAKNYNSFTLNLLGLLIIMPLNRLIIGLIG